MNKGFWMANGGEKACDNPSRIEPKRSQQWLADAAEPELFANKKQAVQAPTSKSTMELLNANASPWENASSFSSVPNQFMERLFGGETNGPFNFTVRNLSPLGTDDSNMRKGSVGEQFGNDSSVGLATSHTMGDPETDLTYSGTRIAKVNHIKDSDSILHAPEEHDYGTSIRHARNPGNETSFISMGWDYGKEDERVMLMGHTYNQDNTNARSMDSTFQKVDDNSFSIVHSSDKGDINLISFGGFHDEPNVDPVGQPLNSYELVYDQSSVQILEVPDKKKLDPSIASTIVGVSDVANSRSEFLSKNKSDHKVARKEAPNCFPSNVRTLISTGMLDGVSVKYVSLSRQELRGTIKGSGYLCGCESCNFSKVINGYEFERHAGCKTKHPNNHIYFENGKTIYQIVQELRSTPESQLFDAIQSVTGSTINQKAFLSWKASFQAATRELKRIYGKEELNLL